MALDCFPIKTGFKSNPINQIKHMKTVTKPNTDDDDDDNRVDIYIDRFFLHLIDLMVFA